MNCTKFSVRGKECALVSVLAERKCSHATISMCVTSLLHACESYNPRYLALVFNDRARRYYCAHSGRPLCALILFKRFVEIVGRCCSFSSRYYLTAQFAFCFALTASCEIHTDRHNFTSSVY